MTANERHDAPSPKAHLDTAAALDRLDGLLALYLDLVHEFLPGLDTVGPQFRALLLAGAMADATRLVHSLKGSSATMGATGLATLAATLEQRCKAGDMAGALARCAELDAMLRATRRALHDALLVLAPTPGQQAT
jgi:two-component system sensor histidine kinase/response regulator